MSHTPTATTATEPFDGWIKLDCGHGWPGSAESTAKAQEFLDLCLATGDSARCTECDEMRAITGPLVSSRNGSSPGQADGPRGASRTALNPSASSGANGRSGS